MGMSSDEDSISAEEFSAWVQPKLVLAAVQQQSKIAASMIFEALTAGILESAAGHFSSVIPGKPTSQESLLRLPSSIWSHRIQDDLFGTGIAQFSMPQSPGPSITMRGFDNRINPEGISRAFPGVEFVAVHTEQPISKEALIEDPKQKGPAVSPAALSAWYEAYKLAYQGPEDTLAKAYASAEGMFPGKFASRQRIRELMQPRSRGRKST